MENENIPTIEGCQSLEECRESMLQIAQRIKNDVSSTMINRARIESMKSLLDLFSGYVDIMEIENKKDAPNYGELLRQAAESHGENNK